MKKKRNKPNNQHRRDQRFVDALLGYNNVAIVAIEGYEGMIGVNLASGRPVWIGDKLGKALQDKPMPWCVFLAAFCRDQNGVEYMKPVEIKAAARYKQERLGKRIEAASAKLEADCNPNHYLRQGWIADPCGRSIDEETAGRIFESMSAWESWGEHEASA